MRKRRLLPREWFAYLSLTIAVVVIVLPLFVAVIGSTHDSGTIGGGRMTFRPGRYAVQNYVEAWTMGARYGGASVQRLMLNSTVMALLIAGGKVLLTVLTSYAVVFFSFPLRNFFFWTVLITVMLPLEVRMFQTYRIATDFGLMNSFAGLALPWIVSTTGTLLLRQHLRALPRSLLDAAKIDGAGPMRCLWSVVLPLIRPNIAALFVILFLYGWNQYLWPLLITTRGSMETVAIGLVKMLGGPEAATEWGVVMAAAVLTITVPVLVVIFMQRYLVKAFAEADK